MAVPTPTDTRKSCNQRWLRLFINLEKDKIDYKIKIRRLIGVVGTEPTPSESKINLQDSKIAIALKDPYSLRIVSCQKKNAPKPNPQPPRRRT